MENERKLYVGTVSFFMPVAQMIQCYARSEDEAKDILSKAHKNMDRFEIVDLYELSKEQQKQTEEAMQKQMEFDFNEEQIEDYISQDKEKLN
jgi:hypothetical protein